jgi:hypothetical protein
MDTKTGRIIPHSLTGQRIGLDQVLTQFSLQGFCPAFLLAQSTQQIAQSVIITLQPVSK